MNDLLEGPRVGVFRLFQLIRCLIMFITMDILHLRVNVRVFKCMTVHVAGWSSTLSDVKSLHISVWNSWRMVVRGWTLSDGDLDVQCIVSR